MNQRVGMLAFIGLILFSAPVAAQRGGRALEFGVKGGATFSTASIEDLEGADTGYRTAVPSGGISLHIPLGSSLAFQPELLYMRKGVTATGGDLENVEVTVKLDYIEIPVLLIVPIGTGEGAAPYLLGGGAVAFETNCSGSFEGEGVTIDVDCDQGGGEQDLEFERKELDFGVVMGAGLRVPAGAGSFLIEGRYTLGLADLNDSGSEGEGFKNRSIAAFIGYSFRLGR